MYRAGHSLRHFRFGFCADCCRWCCTSGGDSPSRDSQPSSLSLMTYYTVDESGRSYVVATPPRPLLDSHVPFAHILSGSDPNLVSHGPQHQHKNSFRPSPLHEMVLRARRLSWRRYLQRFEGRPPFLGPDAANRPNMMYFGRRVSLCRTTGCAHRS